MQLITNERGQIACSDTYLHEVPQVTSGILLDYIAKTGLQSIFVGCLDEQYSLVYWTLMMLTVIIGL